VLVILLYFQVLALNYITAGGEETMIVVGISEKFHLLSKASILKVS
jgi:hypothetical protein